MSHMNGNPHFNKAIWARQHNAGSDKLRENLDRDAATEATLALAYEQRTANLIAAFNASASSDEETETFIGERIDTYELSRAIVARLGLNGGKP